MDWQLVVDAWEPFERGAGTGEWIIEPGVFPAFVFSDELMRFRSALSEAGVMVPFDWTGWLDEEGRAIHETPGGVESADLETLRKLLVAHVRNDRFTEGHLAGAVQDGHIGRIVSRVRELLQSD